jgi:2-oxoisovalerate dehydrogenase E1 component
VWPAMEQIVEMSHEHWRTRGQFTPNVVLRLASGGYIGGGLYHSQNVEAIMGHLPGVRVVSPAFADDAAGLLRTAIRSGGMTFFLEPKFLYNQGFASTPRCGADHAVPFGKARVRRAGTDATNKAAKAGHEVEVIDLRSLRPWDVATVGASVKRTGRLMVVHEDHLNQGLGAEIAATVAREFFEWLDAPIVRVGAKDVPVAFSRILERATLPYEEDVSEALDALLAY